MPSASFHFPKGFLWGTATSSYQVEGGNLLSNWSEWEQQAGKIIGNQKSDSACDWWSGRWKEDFDRVQVTHQNTHRISIEWSRIQPQADRWNEAAIEYYREMLRSMHERGILPMVCLFHFSEPLWFHARGGWEMPDSVDFFLKFVEKIIPSIKDFCKYWITINEPNVYIYEGYLEGLFPPGKQDAQAAFLVLKNLVKAHIGCYQIIHRYQSEARVGIAINFRAFWPKFNKSPIDGLLAKLLHQNYNNSFLDGVNKGKIDFLLKRDRISVQGIQNDFIGVNYYSGDEVNFSFSNYKKYFYNLEYPAGKELSENGFIANIPEGMSMAIKWAASFKQPIIITENGIEDSTDQQRPKYMLEHIHKIWRAANLNIPIKGYYHWTLVDNFEWDRGWTQRFGLWGLNRETQVRIHRKSVDLYAKICQTNSISSDIVQQFTPNLMTKFFPE
jgi:beta-glucosidase